MKLERLPDYVRNSTVILIGLAVAISCGQMTGAGQMKMVALLGGGVLAAALAISLRQHVWLLLPLFWGLSGRIPAAELPLGLRDMAVLFVFGSYLALYALKVLRLKPRYDGLDTLFLVNLLYLATVFVRNPVGASFFGSEMVGGRPYFDIFIAALAFWVLHRVPVDLAAIRRLPLMLLAASALVAAGSLVGRILPASEALLGRLYSAFTAPELAPGVADTGPSDLDRQTNLTGFGGYGMLWLISYFRSPTLFLPIYPLRFVGALICFAAILFSGFRTMLMYSIMYAFMASYFRRRYQDLLVLGLVVTFSVAILAVGNGRIFDLPLSAQRTLSFLPGNWSAAAVYDAQGSTEWRVDMWHTVLTEDKWIQNKWLGDGFGFTKLELAMMVSQVSGGPGFIGGAAQEGSMIVGVYHNGPLSTIRYVGVVGLLLFMPLLVGLAFRGFVLIREARGTTLFPTALFVGLPAVAGPFVFVFIYGAFDENFTGALFTCGLLNLLARGLAELKEKEKPAAPAAERNPAPRPNIEFQRPPVTFPVG